METDERMRFTLIFENRSELGFDQIEEIFEHNDPSGSRQLFGFKVHTGENFFSAIRRGIVAIFNEIVEQKNFIESILLYIVFCQPFFSTADSSVSEGGNMFIRLFTQYYRERGYAGAVSFLIATSIIFVTLYGFAAGIISRIIHRRKVRTVNIYRHYENGRIAEKIRKTFENSTFSPLGYAVIKLYGDNQVHDEFFG